MEEDDAPEEEAAADFLANDEDQVQNAEGFMGPVVEDAAAVVEAVLEADADTFDDLAIEVGEGASTTEIEVLMSLGVAAVAPLRFIEPSIDRFGASLMVVDDEASAFCT